VNSIAEIQDEIVEEFEMLGDDWQDKYSYIVELGKQLPKLPEEAYKEENKVRGCQSNVWMITETNDGKIIYKADSDALIVKGLAALLLRVFSNHTPEEILNANLNFLDRIGLQAHLSPTRNNGLAAMIKQIKFYALAYKTKMENASKE
jgi:cysteine desulfuration protein SufE